MQTDGDVDFYVFVHAGKIKYYNTPTMVKTNGTSVTSCCIHHVKKQNKNEENDRINVFVFI